MGGAPTNQDGINQNGFDNHSHLCAEAFFTFPAHPGGRLVAPGTRSLGSPVRGLHGCCCQNHWDPILVGRCTHFRTYFSGWIGMFNGGTIWSLTQGHMSIGKGVFGQQGRSKSLLTLHSW